jgi:PAS domain-containing protein
VSGALAGGHVLSTTGSLRSGIRLLNVVAHGLLPLGRLLPNAAITLLIAVTTIDIAAPVSAQERQQRVLMLYPDSSVPSVVAVSRGAQKKLAERSKLGIRTFDESLDLSRFSSAAHKQRTIRHLAEKYAETKLDVVVAIGPDSLRIAIDNRDVLAPGVPIVFCCVSPATLSAIELPTDVTGIVSEFNVSKTLELARRLQPTARDLVVIAGAAPFDLRWVEVARRQLEPRGTLNTRYLVGLTREDLLAEVRKLSPDTIVIILTIFRDGAGREYAPADIAEEVANASSAPVYQPLDPVDRRGIVGGHSDSFEDIGTQTGELILRVLDGEDPKQIPPSLSTAHAFRVDARELQRWNLSERNLPPGTLILAKPPGLWEQHHTTVLAAIGLFATMMAAIVLLTMQITRRRRAEAHLRASEAHLRASEDHLRQSEARLGFAAASAGIGLWQYDTRADHLWSSQHCRAMLGLPAETPLTTEALVSAVHPDDRSLAVASIRAATFGKLVDQSSEFRVQHPTDGIRWLQAWGQTSLDEEGRPTRVSGIFRDITSYKAALLEAQQLTQRVMSIQDEERQRIAQDLHDSTAQHITAAVLNLVALRGKNEAGRHASNVFDDIEASLAEASRELRSFTYLLHPPALASDGRSATV